jgi:hypothetical protein
LKFDLFLEYLIEKKESFFLARFLVGDFGRKPRDFDWDFPFRITQKSIKSSSRIQKSSLTNHGISAKLKNRFKFKKLSRNNQPII